MHTGIIEYDLTDEHCVLIKKFKVSPHTESYFWIELTQLRYPETYFIQKFWLDKKGNLKMGYVFNLVDFLDDHSEDIKKSTPL
jgi:hypothetical protein